MVNSQPFIKFAPRNVPLNRRKQTAAVVAWMMLVPSLLVLFLFLASFKSLMPFALAYIIYIYLDPAPEMGGRKVAWLRNLPLWVYMRDFFPMKLVKTCDLDPSRNYVFGYHPHGIIGVGAWVNFATEANGFSNMFHGIDLRLLTLTLNFNVPLVHDFLLAMGVCAVSRRSCDNILTEKPGSSLMIVVGGAVETCEAFPGTLNLILKKRLGFIKLALRTGSPLVPVLSFGENDLWDQVPNPQGSYIRQMQDLSRKYTSVVPPLLHGRGIFNYNVGILPHRRQLVSVVGRPIEVPKLPNPTLEEVQFYQKKYLDELQHIFDTYKDEYYAHRVSDLAFIE
ncbi:diacylglycerol acyltransferase [Globomyces pollinis-pini]|nr:diacylglycerol acyltransferase [Globomyces pollinis-pini]KAJ2996939.1 diacylglycerol O-acyltransferase 1 [Globomyces sp. JEL0801]